MTAVSISERVDRQDAAPAPARARRLRLRKPVVVAAVLALITVTLHLWRISSGGPDVVFDETAYARASWYLGHTGHLTWGDGPVFIHPPVFFLVEAAWVHLVPGAGPNGPALFTMIVGERVLNAIICGGLTALVFALTWSLCAGRRRRLAAASVAAALTAVDPSILHYGRMVLIEPLATTLIVGTLLLAWRHRDAPTARWLGLIGGMTGLCFLTKELSVFFLASPAAYALLSRDWRQLRRSVGALLVGVAVWIVGFAGWAISLGQFHTFVHTKFFTLERLLGIVQTTGLNRPGVSPVRSLALKASVYGGSYLLILLGALSWIVLMRRLRDPRARYVFAVLSMTYAFAGYTALAGQFNEQFFFYVMPFAATGTGILTADFLVTAWRRRRSAAGVSAGIFPLLAAIAVVLATAGFGLGYATQSNKAFQQLAAAVDADVPSCALINTSGEIQAWQYAVPDRQFTDIASGPQATTAGVTYFLLSPDAARNHYPNMSPALASYIERNGTELAIFPSRDYDTYRLYRVPMPSFEDGAAQAANRSDSSVFYSTGGNFCGGYSVADDRSGRFHTGYLAHGGRSELGVPVSRVWSDGAQNLQAFTTVVLAADGPTSVAQPAGVVADIAESDPTSLARSGISVEPDAVTGGAPDSALLTDPVIASAYLGGDGRPTAVALSRAAQKWGRPIGPPTTGPDGVTRQAFADVVFAHAAGAATARLAPLGSVLQSAGIVPAGARERQRQDVPPTFVPDTHVGGVGWLLVLLPLALLLGFSPMAWSRRKRGSA